LVLVELRRSAPFLSVLAGIAMASLGGCSDSGGFNRLEGMSLAGQDGGQDHNAQDGNQDGQGGGRPPGTGGAPVGSGGTSFATGGRGSAGTGGNGGMVATGGVSATGGSPASGGMTATGGRGGAGGATPTGGEAGRSATGGGGGAGGTGGTGGTGGQTAATGGSTGTRPCDGLCLNPISLAPGKSSGNLGTGATCHEVIQTAAAPLSGLNCGNFIAPRMFSVNSMTLACAGPSSQNFPLPIQRNGGYCMQASPGNQSFSYFITF
jgi:hypothetical protein